MASSTSPIDKKADTEASRQFLEQTLRTKIPMAAAMDVTVARYDGSGLVLRAPLAPNVNDKGTAFGGSLFSLAVLAGWGLLTVKLREENLAGDIVIHESTISYRLPVTEDLEAHCTMPGPDEYAEFIEKLRSGGKGKISLDIRIVRGSRTAVHFSGNYVALRGGKN